MSKHKKPETMLGDSSGSDSEYSSLSNDEEEVFYERQSRDLNGHLVYRASMVGLSVPVAATGLSLASTSGPSPPGETWLYDFVDNDWTFPEGQGQSEVEEDAVPASSSSESEADLPTKREPYRPVKTWKERYRVRWLDEILCREGRGDHVAHPRIGGGALQGLLWLRASGQGSRAESAAQGGAPLKWLVV
ncbi:hypothetical protein C8F04DRAFT_1289081 [Mycena alexandri]|uniref:Uncharacterized protein n=1 Tax=Mycena alexandri TaxID=1745969 RepID=A0AAD6SKH0_9AGAR|nr:hypothetical protein C8F04DRAFT_1289081 [Mycena alexandri]